MDPTKISGPGLFDTLPCARTGDWLETYTQKQFYPLDPRPEDFCLEDIAHQLALENRYNGALSEPYSVAQHCVLVCQITKYLAQDFNKQLRLEFTRWALFHDAPEAYIKDLPRPVKKSVGSAYTQIEDSVMQAIAKRFKLVGDRIPTIVKKADEIALATERRDLKGTSRFMWNLSQEAAQGITVRYMDWRSAKYLFLAAYKELF